MAFQSVATTSTSFLSRPTGGGAVTTTSRSSAVSFFSPGKKRSQGTTTNLRLLCRSAPEEDEWWMPQLRPEDLVEPTGHGAEEVEAIRDALVRDPLEPIWLAVQEIVATRGNLFQCRCFHAGIVYGSLLLVAGFCQLYKVAPNLFMDIILGYIFLRCAVLAANLKRSGKANTICARIQCVLIVILFHKCNNPAKDFYYHFTEFFWASAFDVYTCTVFFEWIGIKYPRHLLEAAFKKVLKTIGGLVIALKLKFVGEN